MKILFELENSDLDIEFDPDFRMPGNYSDKAKVQWEFSNRANTGHMDDVLTIIPAEEPVPRSGSYLDSVRLLRGCDS